MKSTVARCFVGQGATCVSGIYKPRYMSNVLLCLKRPSSSGFDVKLVRCFIFLASLMELNLTNVSRHLKT